MEVKPPAPLPKNTTKPVVSLAGGVPPMMMSVLPSLLKSPVAMMVESYWLLEPSGVRLLAIGPDWTNVASPWLVST